MNGIIHPNHPSKWSFLDHSILFGVTWATLNNTYRWVDSALGEALVQNAGRHRNSQSQSHSQSQSQSHSQSQSGSKWFLLRLF